MVRRGGARREIDEEGFGGIDRVHRLDLADGVVGLGGDQVPARIVCPSGVSLNRFGCHWLASPPMKP